MRNERRIRVVFEYAKYSVCTSYRGASLNCELQTRKLSALLRMSCKRLDFPCSGPNTSRKGLSFIHVRFSQLRDSGKTVWIWNCGCSWAVEDWRVHG